MGNGYYYVVNKLEENEKILEESYYDIFLNNIKCNLKKGVYANVETYRLKFKKK